MEPNVAPAGPPPGASAVTFVEPAFVLGIAGCVGFSFFAIQSTFFCFVVESAIALVRLLSCVLSPPSCWAPWGTLVMLSPLFVLGALCYPGFFEFMVVEPAFHARHLCIVFVGPGLVLGTSGCVCLLFFAALSGLLAEPPLCAGAFAFMCLEPAFALGTTGCAFECLWSPSLALGTTGCAFESLWSPLSRWAPGVLFSCWRCLSFAPGAIFFSRLMIVAPAWPPPGCVCRHFC